MYMYKNQENLDRKHLEKLMINKEKFEQDSERYLNKNIRKARP
jgi:hypothetical protein